VGHYREAALAKGYGRVLCWSQTGPTGADGKERNEQVYGPSGEEVTVVAVLDLSGLEANGPDHIVAQTLGDVTAVTWSWKTRCK